MQSDKAKYVKKIYGAHLKMHMHTYNKKNLVVLCTELRVTRERRRQKNVRIIVVQI
jgi:hypothetical protein